MTDMSTFEAQLSEQKAKSRELEENAEQARVLGSKLEDMKGDVSRLENRHRALSAIGKDHILAPHRSYDQRFNMEIEWEPIKSLKSGDQLASEVMKNIDHLASEIATTEREIERLLADR